MINAATSSSPPPLISSSDHHRHIILMATNNEHLPEQRHYDQIEQRIFNTGPRANKTLPSVCFQLFIITGNKS
jgi:hypothetical protein